MERGLQLPFLIQFFSSESLFFYGADRYFKLSAQGPNFMGQVLDPTFSGGSKTNVTDFKNHIDNWKAYLKCKELLKPMKRYSF